MRAAVLGSLAVYGAAAAVFLWLAHRYVAGLPRRHALVLALAPLLFTGRAMFTGDVFAPVDILYDADPFGSRRQELGVGAIRTPLLSDAVFQLLPWRAGVRAAFARGEAPLWNPSVLAGEPLLGVAMPAPFHPGVVAGLPLPPAQAWTLDMTLRLLIAMLCAWMFLRELGCRTWGALLGALGWAFSNWMIFYLGVPPGPAAAPFPLLLLGAKRMVAAPGARSGGITVAALVLIAAAGHPETLFHAVAGGALFFGWGLLRAKPAERLRVVGTALAAGAVALGLCAVVLLPFAEALPHTVESSLRSSWYAKQPRSVTAAESLGRLAPQVMPYAVGVSGKGRLMEGFVEPSAYAGALLFPFGLTGLFGRCRSRWFFALLGLAGLVVSTKTAAADAIAKLPLFDIALNERLVFWTVLSLCVLAGLGANRIQDGEGAAAFLAGTVGSLALLAVLFVRYRERMSALGLSDADSRQRLVLQLVPLLLGLVLIAALSRERRATVGLPVLVAVFAASRVLEQGGTHPTLPLRTFYPSFGVLDRIPRGQPWRVAGLGNVMVPNSASVYGLEDVRGYSAMTLLPFWQTLPIWSVRQPVWFNRVEDPANPFLAFLNVRWVLAPAGQAPPPGWPIRAEGDGIRLLENPRALPRAFVPRFVRGEPDPSQRLALLKEIADFAERGVTSGAGATGWLPNGAARVAIVSYRAQGMELDVEASEETLVATSVTAWPGWKGTLDGSALEPLSYNHAFLAFRVPAGRHRLFLRYAPEGFRIGALVTIATAALLAGLGLLSLRRRRRLRQNPP